jgi:zona occludens toxin (predicted ATPase)
MAITLITGVPGAGKTLLAIKAIYDQVQKNNNPKTKPEDRRPIYTDIEGIDFGGDVDFYDGDWRELPDGSLVVFDEIHRRWPATGRSGMSNDETCSQLDMHRHRGFDFYLITQWPTKLHFEARTNVNHHKHLVRLSGSKSATVYTWQQAQGSPDSRESKDVADTEAFLYPKHLFKHYKSATIHTHKLKIPKKLIGYGALLTVVLSLLFYNVTQRDSELLSTVSEPEITQQEKRTEQGSALAQALTSTSAAQSSAIMLAGCIANDTNCMCYTSEGVPLRLQYDKCIKYLNEPIPFPLTIKSKS